MPRMSRKSTTADETAAKASLGEDVSAQALTEWMVADSQKHRQFLTLLRKHLEQSAQRYRDERLHGAERVRKENDFA